MEDKRLDHIIKEKLERLEDAPYQPDSWDALQERMDAEADMAFDDSVRQKFQHWEAGYQREHWNLLKEQMDAVAARRLLYRYKATELVLVLLLLLTIGQLLPSHKVLDTGQHAVVASKAVEAPPSSEQETLAVMDVSSTAVSEAVTKTTYTNTSTHYDNTTLAPKITKPIVGAVVDEPKAIAASALVLENEKLNSVPPTASSIQEDGTTAWSQAIEPLESTIEIAGIEQQSTMQRPTITMASEQDEKLSEAVVEQVDALHPMVNKISELEIAFLKSDLRLALQDADREVKVVLPTTDFISPSQMRISFMTSANADYIKTPANQSRRLNLAADSTLSFGYSAGLGIGWKQGRTELETGLIYSHKLYNLPFLYIRGEFSSGYEGERLTHLGFDVLELPIQIKYDVVQRGRWRVYPMVGASMHVVTNEIFKYERVSEQNFSDVIGNKGDDASTSKDYGDPVASPASPALAFNHREDEANSTSAFSDSYFTINGGIGLEYRTTERWSVFMQPTFKYSLSNPEYGIGPYNNVIHNSALLVGVKVGL